MKQKKAVVFGIGSLAEVVTYYLAHDSEYDVVSYTATDVEDGQKFLGKPVILFSEVDQKYPPHSHEMFIAVGYSKMNSVREHFMQEACAKGYKLLSYVCSKSITWPDLSIGGNCFIFENNTIQPFVSIGEGTILWSGNHIGHHSDISAYCFLASHVVISGHCRIEKNSFIGVNATISDNVTIAERNLIGPATRIQKSTKPDEVYIMERTAPFPKPSSIFFR